MRYLLDTNIVIFILRDRAGKAAARLAQESPSDVALCAVVEAELYYGATKYGVSSRRQSVLDEFLAPFHSLAFDSACVPSYARIRDDLECAGCVIGGNDLLIAAIALAHDLILVTHNGGEFSRVSSLRIEDWSA